MSIFLQVQSVVSGTIELKSAASLSGENCVFSRQCGGAGGGEIYGYLIFNINRQFPSLLSTQFKLVSNRFNW